MKKPSTTPKKDTPKLKTKSLLTWKKSDITQKKSHSSQFQDGLETTWLNHQPTPHGTKDQPSYKPLMLLSHQKDHWINHWDYHYRMSTKSEVLEPSQSEESKLVSLNQVWMLSSLQVMLKLKSNPSKCITNNWLKPFQETMLVSTLKTSQLKISREETFVEIKRTTHQEKLKISSLKSSSSIIQDKSKPDIAPS